MRAKRYIDLHTSDKIEIIKEFMLHQSVKEMENVIATCFWDRFEIWVEEFLTESDIHEAYKVGKHDFSL